MILNKPGNWSKEEIAHEGLGGKTLLRWKRGNFFTKTSDPFMLTTRKTLHDRQEIDERASQNVFPDQYNLIFHATVGWRLLFTVYCGRSKTLKTSSLIVIKKQFRFAIPLHYQNSTSKEINT